ncbi:hypothetical protein BJF93_22360 [Xaviernesmea oryzae]|uniref:Acetyltransferase n=1 Tax=Xaviernesmea oryzae TaxID=464029 RepID=A0A1Q9B316_9HYPH|nr:CatB-related O-acetyltransferase [Xaviernesmea oryzae]OLP62411.1 hypothetical protein BJF93_22360 [Xaviernesmea oryzae]SEM15568.1 transferase hexapeptide (six repeat-containing protein) [Xaviernesmea oryzae]
MIYIRVTDDIEARLKAQNVIVPAGAHVYAPQGFEIHAPFGLFAGCSFENAAHLGAFSYSWSSLNRIKKIGRYCSIAANVSFGAVEHPTDWLSTSGALYDRHFLGGGFIPSDSAFQIRSLDGSEQKRQDITIGNDVWIGERAYIRGGVNLGDGCIIGTNAVVTKDVPAYAIVVGNPGRVVKMRFTDEIIQRLLESKWHEYSYLDFKGMAVNHVEKFLYLFEKRVARGVFEPYVAPQIRFPDDFT